MTKQIKKLIIACLVLIVLIVGIAVAINIKPKDTSDTGNDINLVSINKEDINKIILNNNGETVEIVHEQNNYKIPSLEVVSASANDLNLFADTVSNITATQEVAVEGDINNSMYGLDNPYANIKIILNDNTEKNLTFGDISPTGSERYTLMDGKLYLTASSVADNVHKTAYDFADKQIIPTKPTDSHIKNIVMIQNGQKINLEYVPEEIKTVGSKENDDKSIEANIAADSTDSESDKTDKKETTETIPAYFKMTVPVEANVNEYAVTKDINPIFGITAATINSVNPTAEEMVYLGFDTPVSILQISLSTGESYTLTVAEKDGVSYMIDSSKPVIYELSSENHTWLNITSETLLETVFIGKNIDNVASTIIKTEKGKVTITANEGQFTSADMKTSSDELKRVISSILDITPTIATIPNKYPLPATVEITISYNDNTKDVLKLFPDGNGRFYIELNGKCQYTTGESKIIDILNDFDI